MDLSTLCTFIEHMLMLEASRWSAWRKRVAVVFPVPASREIGATCKCSSGSGGSSSHMTTVQSEYISTSAVRSKTKTRVLPKNPHQT